MKPYAWALLFISTFLNVPHIHADTRKVDQRSYYIYYADIESEEYGLDGYPDLLLKARRGNSQIFIAHGVHTSVSINNELPDILLCGTPSGGFVECSMRDGAVIPSQPYNGFSLWISDLDRDGIPDLVIHSYEDGVKSLYLANNGQSFHLKAPFFDVDKYLVSNSSEISSSQQVIPAKSTTGRSNSTGRESNAGTLSGLNYSLVGASPGSFLVSNGRAEYSIPINLSQGGAGINPSFSLTYSSGADYGHAGMGFSLSFVSSIERCGRTAMRDSYVLGVRGTTDDMACLDGNRLLLVRGSYWADGSVYRTEGEAFQEIKYQREGSAADQGTFIVYGRNGDIAKYGASASTRIPGNINGGVTGKWALSSVEDRLGYGYTITYVPNTGGEFPEYIHYTLKPALGGTGHAAVELTYETDQYGLTHSVLGRKYQAGMRLSRITNRVNGVVTKQYLFGYEVNTVTNRSLLSEIAECGIGLACLQPTRIEWSKATSPSFADAVYIQFPGPPSNPSIFLEGIHIPRFNGWADINRDKYDDYCRISPTGEHPASPVEVVCYLSDGAGNFSSQINIAAGLTGWRFIENSNYGHLFNWNVDPSWIDINNDGYIDLCYSRPLSATDRLECRLNKSTGASFATIVSYEIPRPVSNKFHVGGRTWVDINGDSLADYCYDYVTSNGKKYVRCAIQKPGFEFDQNIFTKEVADIGGSWVDVNGDGLPDYCVTTSSKITCHINDRGENISYAVWEKSGTNFKSNEPSSYVYAGSTTRWFNAGFFDFTGNGYPDYCRIYRTIRNNMHGYEAACLESLGTGWGNDIISTFMPLTPVVSGGVSEDLLAEAVQFMDINNDGKIDWCIERGYAKQWKGSDIRCFLGTPSGFGAAITNYVLPDLGVNQPGIRGIREINRGWADIYGTGEAQYCTLFWKSVVPYNRGMACYGSLNGYRQDLLSSVENGQGLHYAVQYKDISDPTVYSYEKDTGSQSQIYLSSGMTVVSKLLTSNGIGGLSEQSYFYKNYGYIPDERGGLGFDYQRVVSESEKKKYEAWFSHAVNQHQAGNIVRARTSYEISPGSFRVVSEEEYDWKTVIYSGDGFLTYPLIENIWNKNPNISLRYNSLMLGSTSRRYELDGTLISSTVTENENDPYGNLINQTSVTSGANQSFTKSLINTYQNYPEQWILGRLTRSQVTQSAVYNGVASPPITRTSAWEYYLPSMPAMGGMLHKEIIEPDNPALRTEKHYTYNQFGLKESVTSIYPGLPNQTVSYTYDSQGRFVLQEENALGHTMSYTYDLATGNKTSQTDSNGLTVYWDYDPIGRLKTEISPTGQRSQTRIGGCNTGCPATARYYTESWIESSAGVRISDSIIEYVDVLGRVIETHSPGFSGETIITRTQYDDKGDIARSSEPFVYGTQAYPLCQDSCRLT